MRKNKKHNLENGHQLELDLAYKSVEQDPEISEEMIEKVLKYLLFCLKGNNKF